MIDVPADKAEVTFEPDSAVRHRPRVGIADPGTGRVIESSDDYQEPYNSE